MSVTIYTSFSQDLSISFADSEDSCVKSVYECHNSHKSIFWATKKPCKGRKLHKFYKLELPPEVSLLLHVVLELCPVDKITKDCVIYIQKLLVRLVVAATFYLSARPVVSEVFPRSVLLQCPDLQVIKVNMLIVIVRQQLDCSGNPEEFHFIMTALFSVCFLITNLKQTQ